MVGMDTMLNLQEKSTVSVQILYWTSEGRPGRKESSEKSASKIDAYSGAIKGSDANIIWLDKERIYFSEGLAQ